MRRLLVGLAIMSIAALSPCWVQADDQQIAQQIVQQLRQQKADGKLTGFGIDLEVESGIVWLKGHVTSPEQQQLVLDTARRVDGVTQVVNDISVKSAAPQAEPQVRPALLKNGGESTVLQKPGQLLGNLKGSVQRAFRPETDKAQTTQTAVASKAPRREAAATPVEEPTPAPTPAVTPTSVHTTQVAQTRPAAPSDEQLAEEVINRLRTQKERGTLRNFDVDVQVNDHVVWVSGRVSSEEQQALVLDITRRVRGVKQVVNDLQVTSDTPVQVVSAPVVAAAPAMAPPSQVPASVGSPVPPTQVPAPFPYPYAPAQGAPQVPLAFAPAQSVAYMQPVNGQPMPEVPAAAGVARARFDNPAMPAYAWPSYAAYPNYAAVTYPRQYSPTAWPYIGPFYPYPQVPLGWRKVTMEWDDGWWWLDFKSK
jgi:osmotically-inducible protein OsmY